MSDGASLTLRGALPLTLRAARKNGKLTTRDLAFRMCVTQGFVSKLETGAHCPTIETLESYGAAVGIPAWRLVRHAQNLAAKHATPAGRTL